MSSGNQSPSIGVIITCVEIELVCNCLRCSFSGAWDLQWLGYSERSVRGKEAGELPTQAELFQNQLFCASLWRAKRPNGSLTWKTLRWFSLKLLYKYIIGNQLQIALPSSVHSIPSSFVLVKLLARLWANKEIKASHFLSLNACQTTAACCVNLIANNVLSFISVYTKKRRYCPRGKRHSNNVSLASFLLLICLFVYFNSSYFYIVSA